MGKKASMEAKQAVIVVVAIIAILAVGYYLFVYRVNEAEKGNVLQELAPLNLFDESINVIKAEGCRQVSESDGSKIVSECKENLVIRLTPNSRGNYVMKVCGDFTDGKSVASKAKIALGAMGFGTSCDPNTISFLRTETNNANVYSICGKEVYIKDGCIV